MCRSLFARLGMLGLAGLVGCAAPPPPAGPTPDTLGSIKGQTSAMPAQMPLPNDDATVRAAYQAYLQKAPDDARTAEAMRRLGDLELKKADDTLAGVAPAASPDAEKDAARGAARHYEEKLLQFAGSPDNDQVLYQLSHARELAGDLAGSVVALDRLVTDFPQSPVVDEAQFRRGELLFTLGRYRLAEQAYQQIVLSPRHTPFFERALYMMGWSRYKTGNYDDALDAFLDVLDLKLIARDETASLTDLHGVSAAERELVDDTLRVAALCLANLQGVDTISAKVQSVLRHDYEYRLYQSLAALYLQEHRVKDAADAYQDFVRRYPDHPESPSLLAKVVDVYLQAGFEAPTLDAKRQFVSAYGVDSRYAQQYPARWASDNRDRVRGYLFDVAQHDHALAQSRADHALRVQAIAEYRQWMTQFAPSEGAVRVNFLLAELLFDDAQFAAAASEYERTAYQYPLNDKSADSGYAALLSYAGQGAGVAPEQRDALHQMARESALRFADTFAQDNRVPQVLATTVRTEFAERHYDNAAEMAQRMLALPDSVDHSAHLLAWRVLAHGAFEQGKFDQAETAYNRVLGLQSVNDPERPQITERLAAAIYKQGESARAAGKTELALNAFQRVATVTTPTSVHPVAEFDAAAAQIALQRWNDAAGTLEDFRRHHAASPLAAQVGAKLVAVYVEAGRWSDASRESESLSVSGDDAMARDALWQAAEFADKASDARRAARLYASYVQRFSQPFALAIEARQHLIALAPQTGDIKTIARLQRDLVQAEAVGGDARTARTRLLAGNAVLALADPTVQAYRAVALVEPLKRQLKRKKERLEDALAAYRAASEYGVAEVTTQATFRTADLYRDFAKAMLASERPAKLNKEEREQYDVLLEEQAFPFEEKAGNLLLDNARHTLDGVYDEWVQRSYRALADWKPVRFDKPELEEDVAALPLPADAGSDGLRARLERLVQEQPRQAAAWNQLGVLWRQAGDFAKAKSAYQQAMSVDPQAIRPVLNLAILQDLYLWNDAEALPLYEKYQGMPHDADPRLGKWVLDLRNRIRSKAPLPAVAPEAAPVTTAVPEAAPATIPAAAPTPATDGAKS